MIRLRTRDGATKTIIFTTVCLVVALSFPEYVWHPEVVQILLMLGLAFGICWKIAIEIRARRTPIGEVTKHAHVENPYNVKNFLRRKTIDSE